MAPGFLVMEATGSASTMHSRHWKLWTWALALAAVTCPALAREPYDDAYFVKPKATAAGMFQDRDTCRRQALGIGGGSASYSNPQYGALNAMGSALDEDQLHEGGIH